METGSNVGRPDGGSARRESESVTRRLGGEADAEPSEAERRPRTSTDADTLTHEELLKLTSSTLNSLLKEDALLSDLPLDVTVEEVAAQIALMQGQSINVTVVQDDGVHMNVVVAQNGTVTDLKRAVQRHVNLKLRRAGRGQVKVNWRYVWRTNWLALADGTKLTLDHAKLMDVGIRNRCRVKYIKRLHEKHRL